MHTRNLILTALLTALPLAAQTTNTTTLIDVDHRATTSLDGDWHYIVDPYATGLYSFHGDVRADGFFMNADPALAGNRPVEYNFATSPTLKVPGDWNTQDPKLFYYEGVLWYQRDFTYTPKANTRTFLHIGAANYQSHIWVNTKSVCEHEGGFTAFDCEVTAALKPGKNFVVISVDNTRKPENVPTVKTDWWNYGGLTRDVSLIDVPQSFIDEYDLHLSRTTPGLIEGWVHVEGAAAGSPVTVAIPELKATVSVTIGEGSRATIALPTKSLSPWSPESPKLYKVALTAGADALTDDMGFRTIEARGIEIVLNGKPVFLRGMSVHAEAPYRTGRAVTQKDIDTLLDWAQELGCNFLRLAHYPHDERMTRAADKRGILIWSEIPDYWALQFANPAVLAKSTQQLTEMVRRDRNKAAVILWSVANETPNTEARTKFLTTMANRARAMDASRLITAALLVRNKGHNESGEGKVNTSEPNAKVVDDPLGEALDVIGTNEYIGWYERTPESADNTTWDIKYQKPLIMSEFGGEAKFGNHSKATPPARWSEEYQATIYEHQLPMLNKIPQLRGMSPWILMDFRSPSRLLPGTQDNFNRKGLITENGEKKKAFYVLQKAYKNKTVGKAE